MSFISYAQNFEDVILHRVLKDVEKGFYIDVGANDPVVDSVTKAFYDSGWRGINIEPVRAWFENLQHERPEDINLQCAAGSCNGVIQFYEVIGTGLSTMNESIATSHAQEYGFELKSDVVPVTKLESICEQYTKPEIHFLKIDAEGHEEQVIKGNNWLLYRPWIVLVEATQPMTLNESYDTWEPILLKNNYLYAYADGLNRFYVSQEHKELLSAFKYPPNVFDKFILHNQVIAENRSLQAEALTHQAEVKAQAAEAKAQEAEFKTQKAEVRAQAAEAKAQEAEFKTQKAEVRIQAAETKAQEAEAKFTDATSKASIAENEARQAKSEVAAIYRTRSWRYTKPMRDAVNQFRYLVKYFWK